MWGVYSGAGFRFVVWGVGLLLTEFVPFSGEGGPVLGEGRRGVAAALSLVSLNRSQTRSPEP